MKKNLTPHETALIEQARALLTKWANATPETEDAYCQQVTAFVRQLGTELPRRDVLSLFIGQAAYAAVIALAREGRCVEANRLVTNLDQAACLSANTEAMALLRELRTGLATYYAGGPDVESASFLATATAIFAR